MAEEYECIICNDRGFVLQKDGTYLRCSCKVKKDVLEFLGEYKDFKIVKKIKEKFNIYYTNLIFKKQEYTSFGNIVKTILAIAYLDNPNLTYESVSGNDLIDGLFALDEFGNKINTAYYDCDILIMKLGRDSINKAIPDLMSNLITYRKEQKKVTIIYFYREATDSKIKQYYGDVFCDLIKDYKEIKIRSSIL